MTAPTRPRVVVGADGSAAALAALRWAASEARRRDATLEVVHVLEHVRVEAAAMYAPLPMPDEPAFTAAVAWLTEIVDQLGLEDLEVHQHVETGSAAHALTRVARDADLLVVGAHPHRDVLGITQGSTADACVREALCPVVVVPAAASHSGPPPAQR